MKCDPAGTITWIKQFNGTTPANSYDAGGITLSGISGNKTDSLRGFEDYWIVKIDSSGNKQWDKDFGGNTDDDQFGSISQTLDSGYLLSGTSYSPISGDKTENNLGVEQSWIIKTDAEGNKLWDKTIFTTGHDELSFSLQTIDECYAIAVTTPAGIGGYKTETNQNPNNSYYDYWIIKFCDSTATTSINTNSNSQIPISIYPNPANESLVISEKGSEKEEMKIYDLFGRTVFHSTLNTQHSTFTIDVSKLSSGIYFLKAGNEVRKFIKN